MSLKPILTDREMEVLAFTADGLTQQEIGRRMFVSVDTVKTHRAKLFRKLDARNAPHAVSRGYQTGLLP